MTTSCRFDQRNAKHDRLGIQSCEQLGHDDRSGKPEFNSYCPVAEPLGSRRTRLRSTRIRMATVCAI